MIKTVNNILCIPCLLTFLILCGTAVSGQTESPGGYREQVQPLISETNRDSLTSKSPSLSGDISDAGIPAGALEKPPPAKPDGRDDNSLRLNPTSPDGERDSSGNPPLAPPFSRRPDRGEAPYPRLGPSPVYNPFHEYSAPYKSAPAGESGFSTSVDGMPGGSLYGASTASPMSGADGAPPGNTPARKTLSGSARLDTSVGTYGATRPGFKGKVGKTATGLLKSMFGLRAARSYGPAVRPWWIPAHAFTNDFMVAPYHNNSAFWWDKTPMPNRRQRVILSTSVTRYWRGYAPNPCWVTVDPHARAPGNFIFYSRNRRAPKGWLQRLDQKDDHGFTLYRYWLDQSSRPGLFP